MTFYVKDPIESTKNLLEAINQSIVAGYKVSAKNFDTFLYADNEKQTKEPFSFKILSKNQVLRNQQRHVTDRYYENDVTKRYKTSGNGKIFYVHELKG